MKTNDNQNKSFSLLKEIVVGIIIFCLILIPFLTNSNVLKYLQKISGPRVDPQIFHGDENDWLRSSKYFKLLFIDKDIHNEQWKEYLGYIHPPVGKYIMGLALFIAAETWEQKVSNTSISDSVNSSNLSL